MRFKTHLLLLMCCALFACTGCDIFSSGWITTASSSPEYDYVITYHLSGGQNAVQNPGGYNKGHTQDIDLYDPSREGYVFDCWYADEELTLPIQKITVDPPEDIDIYVAWDFLYELGDEGLAGGLIFYRDEHDEFDWNYLEAAPSGWNGTSSDPFVIFGYYRTSTYSGCVTVGTERAIGSGKTNSENLANAMGETAYNDLDDRSSTDDYAAKICEDYSVVRNLITYDDWFLPSIDELVAMKQNLHDHRVGGFEYDEYWSSSEANEPSFYAPIISWMQDFGNATPGPPLTKQYSCYVRPIRAF